MCIRDRAVRVALAVGPLMMVQRDVECDLADTLALEQQLVACLLYTSDAADERSSVDLGGRRIIKKKHRDDICEPCDRYIVIRRAANSYRYMQSEESEERYT